MSDSSPSLASLRAAIFATVLPTSGAGCERVLDESLADGMGEGSTNVDPGSGRDSNGRPPPDATGTMTAGDRESTTGVSGQDVTSSGAPHGSSESGTTGTTAPESIGTTGTEGTGTTGDSCVSLDRISEPISKDELETLGCEHESGGFICHDFRWVCGPLAEGASTCEECDTTCFERPTTCFGYYAEVICGPYEEDEACCYVIDFWFPCGDGRPFRVAQRSRRAALRPCDAWMMVLAPEVGDLKRRERDALGQAWADAALSEHASVASFARLVLELMAVGAPPDLVRGAQSALADEVEHARLCLGLAAAYSGRRRSPGPLAMDGALAAAGDLRRLATSTVIEGCVGETIAAAMAAVARDVAREPTVRAVLERIAADEARHAALSFAIVRWCLNAGGTAVNVAVDQAFEWATRAFIVQQEATDAGVPAALGGDHGRLPVREREAVARLCLRQIVHPAAAALMLHGVSPLLDCGPDGLG